jgi:hypothetical protein
MRLRLTVFVLVVFLAAGYMLGKAIFTEFTGTEMAAGPPSDFGTVSCPGGQPTGLWPTQPGQFPMGPPCTPGSRVHIRGMKLSYIVQTTDERLAGAQDIMINANFDGWRPATGDPGSGHMWGTIRLELVKNGAKTGEVWEGTTNGTREVTDDVVRSFFHDVAHGSGGRLEGLQADWHVTLNPVSGVGECQGRILNPGGK